MAIIGIQFCLQLPDHCLCGLAENGKPARGYKGINGTGHYLRLCNPSQIWDNFGYDAK